MMNPKDKAKELVDKFDETLTYLESKSKAKQCALICVDEILSIEDIEEWVEWYFWVDVKQEIKKLNHI